MPRPKGMPKTGGRQKGTPNKAKSVREILADRGIDPAERLIDLAEGANDLKAHQRAAIYQTLLEYSQPKPGQTEGKKADEEHNPADQESTEDLLKGIAGAHGANLRATG